jgi:hypothetical protein
VAWPRRIEVAVGRLEQEEEEGREVAVSRWIEVSVGRSGWCEIEIPIAL